ncbi:anti-phage deoxyguanosine triphosphatase [Acinetobacter gyllenbergii]|uniref:anti-phage deoxyguanosine triphosphatase n=1 Tax=Acinetobacter TaxID=469 RepID=UPI0021CDD1CF|nr:anti-phage deoxyguanosine triphosphatase [Acinetobacter dispersus]
MEDMQVWQNRKRNDDEGYPIQRFNSLNDDSQYQRDRARVIHSAAFRRLQAKTQVLGIGESDFYRTRLTHSLEVAQIGSGICERLKEAYSTDENILKWIPSLSLIEAVCLSHDIGHPAFGHGGEVALNYSTLDNGGFEGNGQTLRIISKLGEYSPAHGMDLTRRAMLGIIKYPLNYSQVKNYTGDYATSSKLNLDAWHPPKCIFDDEADVLSWIISPFCDSDKQLFQAKDVKADEHHKTKFKSFDTSIMELADDISYGIHDLEDAIALKLITESQWRSEIFEHISHFTESEFVQNFQVYTERLFSDSNRERKHGISKLVGYFMYKVEVSTNQSFQHSLLRYQAVLPVQEQKILKVLKKFVFNKVIKRPEVQVLEYKGQLMIMRLFEVLKENPNRLLPSSTLNQYNQAQNKERVLSDYISGMTDGYATKLYHKLFSPSIGSIFDRL